MTCDSCAVKMLLLVWHRIHNLMPLINFGVSQDSTGIHLQCRAVHTANTLQYMECTGSGGSKYTAACSVHWLYIAVSSESPVHTLSNPVYCYTGAACMQCVSSIYTYRHWYWVWIFMAHNSFFRHRCRPVGVSVVHFPGEYHLITKILHVKSKSHTM